MLSYMEYADKVLDVWNLENTNNSTPAAANNEKSSSDRTKFASNRYSSERLATKRWSAYVLGSALNMTGDDLGTPFFDPMQAMQTQDPIKTEQSDMSWPYYASVAPKKYKTETGRINMFKPIGIPTSLFTNPVASTSTSNKVDYTIPETGDGKKRVNSWTEREEVFLIGAVVSKYMSKGSLFANDAVRGKRKRISLEVASNGTKSRSNAIDGCWISIKEAFDAIWKTYCDRTGYQRSCYRTAQALSRHYKVMKTKLKRGGQLSFHNLFNIWNKTYNVNNALLHPDYFAIQDRYSPTFVRNQNKAPEPQTTNSWSLDEEVLLVGIVVDRFIKRGSLVSARSKGSRDNDCWTTIKRTYDLAWSRFEESSGTKQPTQRTLNALCRHYKVMRSKFEQVIHELLDRGSDSINAGEEGLQNISLSQLYDLWQNMYNLNNVLVRAEEY